MSTTPALRRPRDQLWPRRHRDLDLCRRIDGVTRVDVDIDNKTVSDDGTAERGAVCAAIEDAGCDVAG